MPTYQALDWKDISREAVFAVTAWSKHTIAEGGTRPHVANVKHVSEFILQDSRRYPHIMRSLRNGTTLKNIKTRCTYGLYSAGWERWTVKSSGGKGMKFIIPWASEDKSVVVISDA